MGWKPVAATLLIGFWVLPASAQVRSSGGSHFTSGSHVTAARSAPIVTRSARGARPVANYPIVGRSALSAVPVSASAVNSALAAAGYGCCVTAQDLFGYPVPGLGFDYANYGALNSNLGVRALIDPATQAQLALALRLQGAGSGAGFYPGYFAPYGGAPIVMETPAAAPAPAEEAPAPQQPIIVVAPPVSPQAQGPAAEEEPLPDPGEFVLVRRDGRLLFAVAFSAAEGRVVYVTKEGLRRTIALDQLDVNATLRMNEERGTTVQLPAA